MRVPVSSLAQALGLCALACSVLAGAAGSAAAEPSEAQIAAIKANCRSDFMSNCWGVKRGGSEAVQCLKQHMASLSPGCQQAMKAAMAAAAPKAPAPAATAAKPESAPATESQAPATAKTAAPTVPQTATSTQTPEPNAASTAEATPTSKAAAAPAPKSAATLAKPAATTQSAPTSTGSAAAAKGEQSTATKQANGQPAASAKQLSAAPAASEAAPAIIGFIPPRKKLMVRRHCRQDLETYCADVSYGDGRLLHCLLDNKTSLSSDCQGALAKLER